MQTETPTKPRKSKSKDPDVPRLAQAIAHGRRSLEVYRSNRKEAVRLYVGNRWSEEGTRERVPVNLIALYCSIVLRSLIARNPRVMLTTSDRKSRPTVGAMEDWANRRVEQMALGNTLQRIVLDGLFSLGIAKVALATPADAMGGGWHTGAGTPFVERVDLDDFVFDPHARDFREASFVGHRFRAPREAVVSSKLYSKARKDLPPSRDAKYNQEGDERVSALGPGYQGFSDEEYRDMVDLWEVYLPETRQVVTLAADDAGNPARDEEPLRQVEWVGPDDGPYHFLAFMLVPGNPMPLAPVMNLIDLAEAHNRILKKLIRQAERQKGVGLVMGGAGEDGSRIVNANDGDMIRCDNPDKVKEFFLGGPNQANALMVEHLKMLFGWSAGNLDIMGGLAAQSKTATQDKLLNENASRTVADMQDTTVGFTGRVLKALCWYWWHDPFGTMHSARAVPGVPSVQVERRVTPADRRRARWQDLDVRVDPYSLQHSTPQSRAAGLNQIVTQVIIPMLPLLQQQRIAFDVSAYLEKEGKYLDMPDVGEIVSVGMEPPPAGQGGGDGGPGMPANTTRTYERRSLGGQSGAAQEEGLAAQMERAVSQGQAGGRMSPAGGGR